MSGGVPPRPKAVKLLQGVQKCRINFQEPVPPSGMPQPPKYLDTEAKREWRRVAPLLSRMGVLTQIDGPAFALYCQTHSQWVTALRHLKEDENYVCVGNNMTIYQNPWFRIAQTCSAALNRILCEFGMTPSSRSRIRATPEHVDDIDEFLETGT
jgi:P27 family predicted phage terminase small subunit